MAKVHAVASAAVASVSDYDAARGSMRVRFRGGAVYEYMVPRWVYEGFMASPWKGEALLALWLRRYPARRVAE